MNNRIQLLIVLKYIMEKFAESEPVSNADILSCLASKNIKPCKMTLIEDLKVIKKAGYDLITISSVRIRKSQSWEITSIMPSCRLKIVLLSGDGFLCLKIG